MSDTSLIGRVSHEPMLSCIDFGDFTITERLSKTIFNADSTVQAAPQCAAFHTISSDKGKMGRDENPTETHF
jgi:hypothetical protein